jgi:hypothetical protein
METPQSMMPSFRRFKFFFLSGVILLLIVPEIQAAFQSPSTFNRRAIKKIRIPTELLDEKHTDNERPNEEIEGNKNSAEVNDQSFDDMLDKPFFEPEQVTEDDPLPVRWFADLVKNDYNTAEALYAGVIFVIMVIISQELLRMQLYGDGYVPFQAGVRPGQLF